MEKQKWIEGASGLSSKVFYSRLDEIGARWVSEFQNGTDASRKAILDEAALLLYCQMPQLLGKYHDIPDFFNVLGQVFETVYLKLKAGKYDPKISLSTFVYNRCQFDAKTIMKKNASHTEHEVSLDAELNEDGFTLKDVTADKIATSQIARLDAKVEIEDALQKTALAINRATQKLPHWEETLKTRGKEQVRANKKLRTEKMVFSEHMYAAQTLFPDFELTSAMRKARYDNYYDYICSSSEIDSKVPAAAYIEFIKSNFDESESNSGVTQKRQAFVKKYFCEE